MTNPHPRWQFTAEDYTRQAARMRVQAMLAGDTGNAGRAADADANAAMLTEAAARCAEVERVTADNRELNIIVDQVTVRAEHAEAEVETLKRELNAEVDKYGHYELDLFSISQVTGCEFISGPQALAAVKILKAEVARLTAEHQRLTASGEKVTFTCTRCGAKGDPPPCEHFMKAWSSEQIAEAHVKLKDEGIIKENADVVQAGDD